MRPASRANGLVWVERCRVAIDNGSLVLAFDEKGEQLELPYQQLNALLLGPGTTVTHDAMRHLSAHGTCVAFVGVNGARIYTAPPIVGSRRRPSPASRRLYWASPTTQVLVAKRMYQKRFGETPRTNNLNALRGMEAAQIKRAYEILAQQQGITWKGRRYSRQDHDAADITQPGDQPRRNRARGRGGRRRPGHRHLTATRLPSRGQCQELKEILDLCDLTGRRRPCRSRSAALRSSSRGRRRRLTATFAGRSRATSARRASSIR